MAQQRPLPELDVDFLQENALTSVRLGIEDFQRCRLDPGSGGDPARALSAVRNLFAGILLLFKFKIAISVADPCDAASLIFNPPDIQPQADGAGGVEWTPVGRFKPTTIDVATIKKRFDGFNIEVNWEVINKLQTCRNHLEHLHPANTLGEVADFVAELFPILRDFIQTQLNEQPADLLGAAWQAMLEHHNFFVDTRAVCEAAWAEAGVPPRMLPWLEKCQCERCSSSLIRPPQDLLDGGASVEYQDETFTYLCLACGHADLIVPVMMKMLDKSHEYDPRNGEEASVEQCFECNRGTFVIAEQHCLWCEAELDYDRCSLCEEPLRQEDQHNDGLCGYHAHTYEKYMRD
ncbi:hypothetical protein [Pseudomonas sp. Irchel s3h17]|uniref:hypothetical protein n=1 Tax=Pseudomonas sp. Irchel s3h17 TaxID=2009182 RepID=UPI000BA3C3E7|nr:hypothetical protein [Pseudomonas sp. Irchel s3h17]